jgi:predicted dehydrogenase
VGHVAVIDRCQERVSELKRTFPAITVYPELSPALRSLDAVVIATPPSTHARLALDALDAGKHVLVEKPLATNLADARAIVDRARERNLVLMVGHTFVYHSAIWALKGILGSARFGALYYLDTSRLNMGLYQHDVNVIWDLAPHDVSILDYLLGGPPRSVECWASHHAHRRLEDIAHLRLRYDIPRVEATIHVSWLHPRKTRCVTAVGSEQMVVFDDLQPEEPIRIYNKSVRQPELSADDLSQPPMSYRYGDVVAPYVVVQEPLGVEDQHFVDCVMSGVPPITDGSNGLAVVEVLDAAEQSLRTGSRIELDHPWRRDGESSRSVVTGVPTQRDPSAASVEPVA